ncbi:MAG: PH domain-containing protein [Candidatus Lokiarchaeota archaeon]|nr:PH domain-containing protein [Candidatus Lokiarchaeota archaeon]
MNDYSNGIIGRSYFIKEMYKVIYMFLIHFGLVGLIILNEIGQLTGYWFEIGTDIVIGYIKVKDILISVLLNYSTIILVSTPLILAYFYFYSKKFVKNYSYKILDEEIIIKRGVSKIKTIIIPYNKIENIKISSDFSERIKKMYTIKLETISGKYNILIMRSTIILLIIFMWIYSILFIHIFLILPLIILPLVFAVCFIKPEKTILGLKNPNVVREILKDKIRKLDQNFKNVDNHVHNPEDLSFDNFISDMLSRINDGAEFKSTLKEKRERAGLSISDLAKKINIPVKLIKHLEERKFSPSLFLAYKIADILKCNVEDLFSL